MTNLTPHQLRAALEWHLENGADEPLADSPGQMTRPRENADNAPVVVPFAPLPRTSVTTSTPAEEQELLGTAALRDRARACAQKAQTLDELRTALADFDGLDIKKTATQMVFSDGNPRAPVMVVGEAPGADEDRIGRPFVGVSGQLLDRILACIGLDRAQDDPAHAVYIANILNWRPPGNRTPTPQETDISLPFIERHIALAQPRFLVLAGGVSAKTLLRSDESISRLRGRWHAFTPLTPGVAPEGFSVPALATYHPSYLLRTPSQKKAVWQDMLMLQARLRD